MDVLMKMFLVSLPFGFTFYKDCNSLPDGTYKVRHTYNSEEPESELKIEKGLYKQKWHEGVSTNGKLIWLFKCQFRLAQDNPPKADTSNMDRLLLKSFGVPVFELQSKKGDTIFFRTTFSANLHLTGSRGYLLKVE